MKIVSLFSGIGAYERALENVGVNVELVNYCEILKDKSRAYSILHNVSEDKNLWDVTAVDTSRIEDFDLLVYSPPCFTAGHLVMTDKGYKKIEDVVEGDMVLTHKGRYKKVLNTMCKSVMQLQHTYIKGVGPYIESTPEHPFYVKNRKSLWRKNEQNKWFKDYEFSSLHWKAANELENGDFCCMPILSEDKLPEWYGVEVTRWKNIQNNLSTKFTDKRFWYFVGRFLGDDWVRITEKENGSNRYEVRVCCSFEEIEKLKKEIGNLFNYVVCKDSTAYKLIITDKELVHYMLQFGRGAENKEITSDIYNLPIAYLQEVVRGLMDSDGCILKYNGYPVYQLTSVSKKLVYGLGYILNRLNYSYSITYVKRPKTKILDGRVINQKNTYMLRARLHDSTAKSRGLQSYFKEGYIYNPFRKSEIINLDSEVLVYNLEVEEDNSYTVENVIVHNCQSFSISGKMQGLEDMRGTLFYNALEVIRDKKPKYCVMENVDNLATKFSKDFEDMRDAIEMLGYNNYWKIINAKDFIPQNRKRVYLVSIRKDIDDGTFEFPDGNDCRNWQDIIDFNDTRPLTNRQQRMVDFAMGNSTEDIINLEGEVQFDNAVITLRQSGLRFQNNREYPTITAYYGKGGGNFTMIAHNGKVGGITPRNCFKLMGFEFKDSELLSENGFSNSSQYIMAGDSVCVPVLEGIFENLLKKK